MDLAEVGRQAALVAAPRSRLALRCGRLVGRDRFVHDGDLLIRIRVELRTLAPLLEVLLRQRVDSELLAEEADGRVVGRAEVEPHDRAVHRAQLVDRLQLVRLEHARRLPGEVDEAVGRRRHRGGVYAGVTVRREPLPAIPRAGKCAILQ